LSKLKQNTNALNKSVSIEVYTNVYYVRTVVDMKSATRYYTFFWKFDDLEEEKNKMWSKYDG